VIDETPEERGRLERPVRFLRNRLSPERTLGLHLTIGLIVVVFCAWCFSEIAEEIGPRRSGTRSISRSPIGSSARRIRASRRLAHIISFCGSVAFLAVVSVGFAIYFLSIRAWNRLLELALTMLGGSLLNILLKHFFQRQRPVLENPLVTLTSFGFPSGHTMGATLLYGLLALIAARLCDPHPAALRCSR
jgi:undecaprenyl-diphosphatase